MIIGFTRIIGGVETTDIKEIDIAVGSQITEVREIEMNLKKMMKAIRERRTMNIGRRDSEIVRMIANIQAIGTRIMTLI